MVDSLKEKRIVKAAQWSVKWRLWLFQTLWYGAWMLYGAPFAFGMNRYQITSWNVLPYEAILLLVGFAVFQTNFYVRIAAGGEPVESEGRFKYFGYVALAIGLLIGLGFAAHDPNEGLISGLAIWFASALIIVMMNAGPDRKPKELKVPITELVKEEKKSIKKEEKEKPKAEENTQNIAVRTVDGRPVPSDVLDPGRYKVINFFFLIVGISFKKVAGKMDIDVVAKPVKSSTEEKEQLILNAHILYRWPALNPVHLVDAFGLPGIDAARDAFDGPVNSAARAEIDKCNYATLNSEGYPFKRALFALFGRDLTQIEMEGLKTRDPKIVVYSPVGIEVIYLDFSVQGTLEQQKNWDLQSKEGAQRPSEMYDSETTVMLAAQIIEQALQKGWTIPPEEALIMAQRKQGQIVTHEYKVTGGEDLRKLASLLGLK